jgi:hypothetical protein
MTSVEEEKFRTEKKSFSIFLQQFFWSQLNVCLGPTEAYIFFAATLLPPMPPAAGLPDFSWYNLPKQ